MKETINILRQVSFDSAQIKSSPQTYSLFNDIISVENNERIDSWFEERVVKWIFNSSLRNYYYLIYDELGIPEDYKFYLSVRKPILENPYNETDIDFLLVNPLAPNKVIAFQVKKIKANFETDESINIKIRENKVIEGIGQAKYIYDNYRFHLNYLMLAVVNESQNKKSVNQIFRTLPQNEFELIVNLPSLEDLPEDIGIFYYEVSKPNKTDINFCGTILSKIIKHAKPVEQDSRTTEKVIQLIKQSNN
jgi:hypothetical protein